jgi:hypothetical protein
MPMVHYIDMKRYNTLRREFRCMKPKYGSKYPNMLYWRRVKSVFE